MASSSVGLRKDDGMYVSEVGPALERELGPEATEELVDMFDAAEEHCVTTVVEQSVERFERRLTEQVSGLRVEMVQGHAQLRQEMTELGSGLRQETTEVGSRLRQEMTELRSSLRQEITALGGNLRQEMASQRVDLLKWSFLFWIGQVVAMTGIITMLLRASGR